LAARRAAELGGERRCLDAKLLHRVHRHQAVRAAVRAERGQRAAGGLHHGEVASDAEVGADPVHHEVVRIGALAVHAELPLVVERRRHHNRARCQHDQRLEAAAVEREVVDERPIDHGADRSRGGIHQRRACIYRDDLRHGPQRHLEIELQGVLHLQDDVGLDQCSEAGLFDFDAIRPGRKVRKIVLARVVCGCDVTGVGVTVDGGDCGAGNDGVGRIDDTAREEGTCGLSEKNGRR